MVYLDKSSHVVWSANSQIGLRPSGFLVVFDQAWLKFLDIVLSFSG